jgi:hypothetical protein
MLIDIVSPGWAPICLSNLTENIPGFAAAYLFASEYDAEPST